MERLSNWADCYTYTAARVHRPGSVDEVRALVARATRVKALGTRHSFNHIADTAEDLVSTENLNRIVSLDRERNQVTVEGGIPYGRLAQLLHSEGFGLHNLASLPHISVAGAIATATHGSGDRNGNLATAVAGLEIVIGDGSIVTLSREKDGDTFNGAVVSLGALGIVTKVTLDVQPTYEVRQRVYDNVPLSEIEGRYEAVTGCGYSVSFFTRWAGPAVDMVWVKDLASAKESTPPFAATAADDHRHPIPGASPINCTAQMGEAGAWHDRLPHFRMDFTPSSGEELQAEYLVPRPHAWEALMAIDAMREQIAPHLQISEIRTMAADDLWMSPSYHQDCIGIHFTWKKDWESVRQLLPVIEARLAPFEARPHWGKLFTMAPEQVQAGFERLGDFRQLAERYDPDGKFRNAYLDRYVFG